jgi:tripartite-type tricarboxylate transporter receptor subunit TctC
MLRLLLVAATLSMLWVSTAVAESVDQFFAGKTVRIIHGATVGGEYDLYARLVARHIAHLLPGKPAVIVQSMPGAGGLTAIRHLANVAPRDGTVVIVPQVNILQDGLLTSNPQYDPRGFRWIGRMAAQLQVGLVSSKSGVKSLEEAKSKELIAGGYGNNPTTLNPRLLNRLIGTRFKVVAGYNGTGAVMIAWERGEVDLVTTSWDFLFARYADQVKAKTAIPLYLNAPQRSPALPDVPLMTEFGQKENDKAFLRIYDSNSFIGRALAAPPGVPDERIGAWRIAFMKMFDDPGFKETVRNGSLRLDPLSGDEMTSHLAKVLSLSPEMIAMAKKFYDDVLAQPN